MNWFDWQRETIQQTILNNIVPKATARLSNSQEFQEIQLCIWLYIPVSATCLVYPSNKLVQQPQNDNGILCHGEWYESKAKL